MGAVPAAARTENVVSSNRPPVTLSANQARVFGSKPGAYGAGLQAMIDEFDKDGDGEISENEFLGIMKQTSIY